MPYRPKIKNADGSLKDLPIEAETSVKLKTGRSIGLSGVTATAKSFDGSGNITIPVTAVPVSLLTGSMPFITPTFIIDSDAKFACVLNNTAGNDYTVVLIKKGTYNTSEVKGWDLSVTGTLQVYGEPGSILQWNNMSAAIKCVSYGTSQSAYDERPEAKLVGVHIKCTGTKTSTYGFCFLSHMYNCIAEITIGENSGNAFGFFDCRDLIGCFGYAEGLSAGYGFNHCEALIFCRGYGINHHATPRGWGFASCYGIWFCRKWLTSTTTTFLTEANTTGCYATLGSSASTTYLVANTPNGGFNNPA